MLHESIMLSATEIYNAFAIKLIKMKKKNLLVFAIITSLLACSVFMTLYFVSSSKSNGGSFLSKMGEGVTIDRDVHDFGVIKEDGGNVSATFVVINNTKEPVVITYATASCGCTIPSWTKEPIPSGKTGRVTATFIPKNHPGPFDKSIMIMISGQAQRIVARITGTVK